MEQPDYPATCNDCGAEGTNASLDNHECANANLPTTLEQSAGRQECVCHKFIRLHDGDCPVHGLVKKEMRFVVNLTERELHVIINALNYAKGEWATCDDQELSALSNDADALEQRLKLKEETK